jgi:tRNA (guanine-N7-)-methyltransferase
VPVVLPESEKAGFETALATGAMAMATDTIGTGAMAAVKWATGTATPATRPVILADTSIRTFVLRAGRITEGQKSALDTLGPRFILPFQQVPLDLPIAYGNDRPVIMEIGFGMGQATWRIARDRADFNYLGVEVHAPGVGRLLIDIGREGLENLRIIQHDAVEVLETMVRSESLAAFHVFYPDPWPKKRHHKRRLMRPGLVELLVSRLAPGGYLYFVTDIEEYGQSTLELLTATPGLRNRYPGFAPLQDWRPETKFEAKGLVAGHGPRELLFEKAVC